MVKRVIDSPIGPLGLYGEKEEIVLIGFGESLDADDDSPVLLWAEKELTEYFAGKRRFFTFPWRLERSGFEGACLRALARVPNGETVSYGRLAAMAGSPRGARAAGNAVHKNPLPIVIPCHRVIMGDGRIGGFGGDLRIKRELLKLEGVKIRE
ncbi:MAG: methylated-DNA--[Spirochaetales bacterium]|nr:methylated-DNA--[protein]-cysteine S-methyltransferase [Spirochaetales bacterium]